MESSKYNVQNKLKTVISNISQSISIFHHLSFDHHVSIMSSKTRSKYKISNLIETVCLNIFFGNIFISINLDQFVIHVGYMFTLQLPYLYKLHLSVWVESYNRYFTIFTMFNRAEICTKNNFRSIFFASVGKYKCGRFS